jgi:RimK family alpha-L-glutamate ligase
MRAFLRATDPRLGGTVISTLASRQCAAPTAFIVGSPCSRTNQRLRAALAAGRMQALMGSAELAATWARAGDLVVGRLDVRPTLDGVQPGLGRLMQVRDRGIRVVNGADTLVATHDKLLTSLLLDAASIPQPSWVRVTSEESSPWFDPPYVVKPRFGSWGRDVSRYESRAELRASLRHLVRRPWFRRHGALVQELIPPQGFDLRLIVSAGTVVGAIQRVAAPGEWRTNIALGGWRQPTTPSLDACALAIESAAAVGGDLVGVDLLPDERGWRVVEVNGAVDFTDDYALDGRDVFARAVEPFAARDPIGVAVAAGDVTPPVQAVSA